MLSWVTAIGCRSKRYSRWKARLLIIIVLLLLILKLRWNIIWWGSGSKQIFSSVLLRALYFQQRCLCILWLSVTSLFLRDLSFKLLRLLMLGSCAYSISCRVISTWLKEISPNIPLPLFLHSSPFFSELLFLLACKILLLNLHLSFNEIILHLLPSFLIFFLSLLIFNLPQQLFLILLLQLGLSLHLFIACLSD